MVNASLQTLGKDLKLFLEDSQKTPFLESGVFLFMSFDLADSTAFKTEHPTLWASVFTNFYGKILERLGVENYSTPEDEETNCVRKLWKLIGDEVLLYVRIEKISDLYTQVTSVNTVLNDLMQDIAEKVERETQTQGCETECTKHCKNIREVIMSTLGIKTSMWIAKCFESNKANATNIVYKPLTTTTNTGRIDFLGKDIDEGFRMAKYAVKNKIIVSPLLAWLIWESAREDKDKNKIINSNFKITAFVKMKGVWRNRKVPIVMFHQQFEKIEDILEYDELDLETYQNIKENGFDKFKQDKRFSVERIDTILENVYQKKDALEVLEELKNPSEVNVQSSLIDGLQELHIACVLFDDENNILVHNSPERGLEFGCIKKVFGVGANSWKKVCIKGYKEKYGILIDLEENPIPIATYFYDKSNAFGLILMAKYINGIEGASNWKVYSCDEIENYSGKTVDSFKENAKRATNFRKDRDLNG